MVRAIQVIKQEQEPVMVMVQLGVVGQVGIDQAVRRFPVFVIQVLGTAMRSLVVLDIQVVKHEEDYAIRLEQLTVVGQVGIGQAV